MLMKKKLVQQAHRSVAQAERQSPYTTRHEAQHDVHEFVISSGLMLQGMVSSFNQTRPAPRTRQYTLLLFMKILEGAKKYCTVVHGSKVYSSTRIGDFND